MIPDIVELIGALVKANNDLFNALVMTNLRIDELRSRLNNEVQTRDESEMKHQRRFEI